MRELPPIEASEEDIRARQVFEQYMGNIQASKISVGISAVTGALAGAKAGIPGVVVGAAVGALTGYWNRKAYRTRVYAELDALGLLRKPRFRYRGTVYLKNQDFVFMRYPYAEQTALIILPILQKYYPDLTVQELTEIGHSSQRTLIKFRQQNQDIPLALAAEAILAYYGIIRNSAGVYDLAYKPEPGAGYQPPPVLPPVLPPESPPPEDKEDKKPSNLIYLLIAGIVLLLLLERR